MSKTSNFLAIILLAISLILLGCAKSDDSSSSSQSDDVSAVSGSGAISLSAKVSMVSAKGSASTARTANAINTSGFASTADYNVDGTQTFVYEESADVLDSIVVVDSSRVEVMIACHDFDIHHERNRLVAR